MIIKFSFQEMCVKTETQLLFLLSFSIRSKIFTHLLLRYVEFYSECIQG